MTEQFQLLAAGWKVQKTEPFHRIRLRNDVPFGGQVLKAGDDVVVGQGVRQGQPVELATGYGCEVDYIMPADILGHCPDERVTLWKQHVGCQTITNPAPFVPWAD